MPSSSIFYLNWTKRITPTFPNCKPNLMRTITLSLIILFFQAISVFGQELEHPDILVTNDNWGKELFQFPIRFAKEIQYTGMEEARFPKGWGDSTSTEFWTYAFAWEIETEKALIEADFEINLQYYFDGLLGLNFDRKEKVTQTNANFINKEVSNNISRYAGKIKTFDTRFTQKPMTLHVQALSHFCEKEKQSIVLFKFSPKPFEHAVWKKLDGVKIKDGFCDH